MGAGASASRDGAGFPALIASPDMPWVGEGRKGLVGTHKYSHDSNPGAIPKDGRGQCLVVGMAAEVLSFVFEGDNIVNAEDKQLALELNHRKYAVDNTVSLWNCQGHRDWFCKWTRNADGTISPHGHPELVLGIKQNQTEVVLVRKDDTARRLVFLMGEALQAVFAEESARIAAEKAAEEAMKEAAIGRCTPAFKEEFMHNGFIKMPGFVPQELVKAALAEINRKVGRSADSPDAFKAKTFAEHPAITNLVNRSGLPYLLRHMLGGEDLHRFHQHSGQLALRFPGDQCDGDRWTISSQFYDAMRRGWHIDGCPNNFIPGQTDHWGEVHNFDCLIGVLLSDVHETMSGELCCYPGSHYILADYFKQKGFDDVYRTGKLPTGPETDTLFKEKATHCLGNAGDVFLANYMTAHFIAPNVSPNIRYAVYFRTHGPVFGDARTHHPESMLDPWLDWPGVNGRGADGKLTAAAAATPEAVERVRRFRRGYSTLNNDHLQGPGLCKSGCGRPVAPGVSRSGKAFDTCCKDCATGKGSHTASCREA